VAANKILEIIVESTKSPEAVRGIRNLLILTKVVGSDRSETMNKFTAAVPGALAAAAKRKQPNRQVLGALRILRSKNLRRGLAVMNGILKGWQRVSPLEKATGLAQTAKQKDIIVINTGYSKPANSTDIKGETPKSWGSEILKSESPNPQRRLSNPLLVDAQQHAGTARHLEFAPPRRQDQLRQRAVIFRHDAPRM